jgi:ABC-type antimicrobial peptide transport system permease subunit
VRVALGATTRRITGMVMAQGVLMVAGGLAIGVAGAVALGGILRGLLFGVTPTDPVTYLAVSSVLAAVALLGAYLPARRAARIDPAIALRSD